ncbi:MAG: metal-dependent transcriptional regulator [Micrococcales bacterium]
MHDLIDTTEMYLRTVLELLEEGQIPMRARISERLDHSGPTVSQTVARMERDGLLLVRNDRQLELTPEGLRQATRVMRKHRLAERLLADVIGLDWEYVHEEACRWEHVMSEQVERKIIGLISTPDRSPYGNPIPGLDELGLESNPEFNDGVVNLISALDAEGKAKSLTLRRIGEPIQIDPEFLNQLKVLGLTPGVKIDVEHADKRLFISPVGSSEGLAVDHDIALHFYVNA